MSEFFAKAKEEKNTRKLKKKHYEIDKKGKISCWIETNENEYIGKTFKDVYDKWMYMASCPCYK